MARIFARVHIGWTSLLLLFHGCFVLDDDGRRPRYCIAATRLARPQDPDYLSKFTAQATVPRKASLDRPQGGTTNDRLHPF
jgi:hypothetical protein